MPIPKGGGIVGTDGPEMKVLDSESEPAAKR